jgi:hypothetical protein
LTKPSAGSIQPPGAAARRWVTGAYGVFTAYAAVSAGLSGGEDRVWAIWAVCGYGIGTLLLWRMRGWTVPLVVSLALALVAPLLWNSVAFRLEDGMVVINRSAELLIHHGSPYLPAHEVRSWFSYNPYLPVMALFGMPAAAGWPGLLGNAGVWLAVATIVVLGAAFWIAAPPGAAHRGRTMTVAAIAVASPVIALNLAVITTDPPVLAFILLSLAFAARPPGSWSPPGSANAVWAGAALAVACVLKDTAWLAIPVMLAMFWCRDGLRAAIRFILALLAAALVLIAVLAPATLVHPAATKAMIRDTILFPLGLTTYKTPAQSLLPGHLLTQMGTAGHVLSVGLLLAAGLAVGVSLVVRPPRDVRAAAWRLAIGLTLMFALGPDVRFGYFLYPLGLLGWLALTPRPADPTPAGLRPDVVDDRQQLADQGAQHGEPGQPDEALR